MHTGAAPREAVLAILRAVRAGATFDQALERALPGLDTRDRRLAHEIAAGVLRERTRLDDQIRTALARPNRRLAADVHDILRIGAYQLQNLDRVPDYAVVNSAVDLAKSVHEGSAPLVNAVLRRLSTHARTGTPAPDTQSDLATRYSHPAWLVNRWTARFGTALTEQVLASNNRRPPLTIQPVQWTADRLLDAMCDGGIPAQRLPADRGIALEGIRTISVIPGFEEGAFIVQDPAQKALLDFAAVPAGVTVWDACAAPGGKAALLSLGRRVFATDSSARRVRKLVDTVRRAAPSVTVLRANAAQPPWRPYTFEWVVVDAPCSGTGAMARHPDARWRLNEDRIAEAAVRQEGILDGAATTVKTGGILVYLTCSLEAEENSVQVDRFIQRHPEFVRIGEDLLMFPSDGTDGGYGACLVKADRES